MILFIKMYARYLRMLLNPYPPEQNLMTQYLISNKKSGTKGKCGKNAKNKKLKTVKKNNLSLVYQSHNF